MDNETLKFKEFHWIMSLLQAIDVGVIVIDQEYKVQIWNSFMENHSGLRPEVVRGNSLFEFFPEIPEDWFKHKVDSVFMLHNRAFSTWEQRPYVFRFKNYRPITGLEEFMYQNLSMIPLTSPDGSTRYICIVVYDVTDVALSKKELKSANSRLREQSQTDQLTGLNNRGYWEKCLIHEYKRYLRYGDKCSLAMLDIDHFKKVNDTYGHQFGDKVLCTVARTLTDNIRGTDIAGRYGGEEFGVVLTGSNNKTSKVFAERFRKSVEALSISNGDKNVKITVSIGLTEFSDDIDDYKELIERADKALYESKRSGRNRITIYSKQEKVAAIS